MNRFSSVFLAASLSCAGTAFAAESPVTLNEAQLDTVTAGIANFNNLVAVDVNNVANNNQVQVAVPVNAAVGVGAVGILSRQSNIDTSAITQPGNVTQAR